MMRTYRWVPLLAVLLLLLAACSSNKEADSESKESKSDDEPVIEKEKSTEQENSEKETQFKNIYPLTGEPTNESVDHRVVSVMVNNHTKARPQTGLNQADVVYEVLAEGQITRFLALFHSDIPDKMVGPVRSARPYYLELAEGYQALYVHHGASPEAYQQIRGSNVSIDGITYDNNGWLFERSSDRSAPHDSYFLTDGLDQIIEQRGYSNEGGVDRLPFSEDVIEGEPIGEVTITYSDQPQEVVSFKYDDDLEQFLRSSDGEPTVDLETDERIAVENVWIVEANHQVIDDVGRRDVDLTSGGKGYLLQKGQLLEVEWKNVDGRILPFKDGKPVSFNPGKTWVNIVPKHAEIETTKNGN